jgi:3-isopropylmalate dehydrogenase
MALASGLGDVLTGGFGSRPATRTEPLLQTRRLAYSFKRGEWRVKTRAVPHAGSLTRLKNAEFRDDAYQKTEVGVMPKPRAFTSGRGISRAAPEMFTRHRARNPRYGNLLSEDRLACVNFFAVNSNPGSGVSHPKHIAVIPGDGIGQEVIPQAVKVIQASGAAVELTAFDWGAERYLRDQTTVPADGFALLGRDFDAILAGAFGDPRVPTNIHAKEILLGMRFQMDLYANVRPVRLLDAALCPLKGVEPKDVDFVVLRENTEGVYTDAGGVFKQGTPDEVAIQEDINTRKGVERIIRYAFEYCGSHAKLDGSPRKRVLMSDKSNAMTHAGGLWQRTFKEVAREYPKITTQHMYVDALCMQMVRDPRQFDVIVTNNMFGDIVTDIAAGLQGGLGMAASGNIHPGKTSMFEPVHGSAPPIAGKNMANPFGAILTTAMMLNHLGLAAEAAKIEAAVLEAVRQKKSTQDVGGSLGTREAGAWVAERVSSR